jgi:hypothetical protein
MRFIQAGAARLFAACDSDDAREFTIDPTKTQLEKGIKIQKDA